MKVKTTKFLKSHLPDIGLWFRHFWSGKPNVDVGMTGKELSKFLKEGYVGKSDLNGDEIHSWKMVKCVEAMRGQIILEVKIKARIIGGKGIWIND